MTEEFFWPDKVSRASIPEGWTVESAIVRVKRNVGLVKPKLQTIVMDFYLAHEQIVQGRAPGWTWTKFCEEAGISRKTPLNWFEKYGLPFTITRQKLTEENYSVDVPPKVEAKVTEPKLKEMIEEVGQAIVEGKVADDDIQAMSQDIGTAVKTKVANSRVAAPAASAFKAAGENKERQEDFRTKKSTINELHDLMGKVSYKLTLLSQGDLPLESGDEIWVKGIRMKAPAYMMSFYKLGINLMEVYRVLINPNKELSHESESEDGKKWLPAGNEVEIFS